MVGQDLSIDLDEKKFAGSGVQECILFSCRGESWQSKSNRDFARSSAVRHTHGGAARRSKRLSVRRSQSEDTLRSSQSIRLTSLGKVWLMEDLLQQTLRSPAAETSSASLSMTVPAVTIASSHTLVLESLARGHRTGTSWTYACSPFGSPFRTEGRGGLRIHYRAPDKVLILSTGGAPHRMLRSNDRHSASPL